MIGRSSVASGGGVAEEARTRGVAAPAFAGCAFVEGAYPTYEPVARLSITCFHVGTVENRQSSARLRVEQLAATSQLSVGAVPDLPPLHIRLVRIPQPLSPVAHELRLVRPRCGKPRRSYPRERQGRDRNRARGIRGAGRPDRYIWGTITMLQVC
jgi:hypothetical protein